MSDYLADEDRQELASISDPDLKIIYMNQQKIMEYQIRQLTILRTLNVTFAKFCVHTLAPVFWGVMVLLGAFLIVKIWGIDKTCF